MPIVWDFYRNRGPSVVRMHRRRGGVTGIYRCVIPDATGVNQTMYIGLYTGNTGEYACMCIMVHSLIVRLTCNYTFTDVKQTRTECHTKAVTAMI